MWFTYYDKKDARSRHRLFRSDFLLLLDGLALSFIANLQTARIRTRWIVFHTVAESLPKALQTTMTIGYTLPESCEAMRGDC